MKADNRSGFHYKRSENTSSKVLGMHRKVDTKTLNKLFCDFWPTDYVGYCILKEYDLLMKKICPCKPDIVSLSFVY